MAAYGFGSNMEKNTKKPYPPFSENSEITYLGEAKVVKNRASKCLFDWRDMGSDSVLNANILRRICLLCDSVGGLGHKNNCSSHILRGVCRSLTNFFELSVKGHIIATCLTCKHKYTDFFEALTHIFKNHGNSYFKCTLCNEKCVLKNIKKHKRNHLKIQLQKKIKCKSCNFIGENRAFIHHLLQKHNCTNDQRKLTRHHFDKFCDLKFNNLAVVICMITKQHMNNDLGAKVGLMDIDGPMDGLTNGLTDTLMDRPAMMDTDGQMERDAPKDMELSQITETQALELIGQTSPTH